eukprot:4625677-Lingulodinium_polyedra.AAC.1
MRQSLSDERGSFPAHPDQEPEEEEGSETGEEEKDEDEDQDHSPSPDTLPPLTESQKLLVQKVHVNLAHPSRDQFLRALRAARAKPEVLHYVKTAHRCSACEALARPRPSRRA